MIHSRSSAATFGGISAALFFLTSSAVAKTPLSVDVNYAEPLIVEEATHGWGADLRWGSRLDLKVLTLDSEIVGGGVGFYDGSGRAAAQSYRGLLGTRLGLLWGIRPSVYSHLGLGHTTFDSAKNQTSLGGDLGAALDLTFFPAFDIGAQGAWNFVLGDATSPPTQYLTMGLHVTFVGKD